MGPVSPFNFYVLNIYSMTYNTRFVFQTKKNSITAQEPLTTKPIYKQPRPTLLRAFLFVLNRQFVSSLNSSIDRPSSNVELLHVPSLIPPIKYIKKSAFESIKCDISYLGLLLNWVRVAHIGISTEERLGLKRRTFQAPNLMHKLL